MKIVYSDTDRGKIHDSLANAEVVIFTGGADISPSLYGQDNTASHPIPARDRKEVRLYHLACALDIPILGICRGHQLIAALRGGVLLQHVDGHWGQRHELRVPSNNHPFRDTIYDGAVVNSIHHQVVITCPPTGQVIAYSPDGYIEAIWYPSDGFHPPMLGVQWHPEIMGDVYLYKILEKLIK